MSAELPFGINSVFVIYNLKLRDTLIRAIAEASGLKPAMKSDSESAKRAHYAPATSEVIINTASPQMHADLGPHCCALAVKVEDRIKAATVAQKVFENAGYHAVIHTHPEPEFPDGFLTFVTVKELGQIVLMFWPTTVTPEIQQMLPQRTPWRE